MTRKNVANVAFTATSGETGPTDLTFNVESTAKFPDVPFEITVLPAEDEATWEIVNITVKTGTTLVAPADGRYQDGSSALSGLTWPTGSRIRHGVTKGLIDGIYVDIDAAQATADAALPKAGGTMTGPVVFGDQLLSRAVLKDTGETVHDLGTTSGTVTIDYTNGPWQRFVANGAVTLAFTNFPADGTGGAVLVEMKQDATGSRTLTYPAAVEHEGDVAPTISTAADKTDLHVFLTRTGGTKVYHPKPKLGFTP